MNRGNDSVAWLEKHREIFGPPIAVERERHFATAAKRQCRRAADLLSFHESVCFACSYPDDAAVWSTVQNIATRFHLRKDVRRFSDELEGLGIAGIPHRYRLYWPSARWLATRFPGRLTIDWTDVPDDRPLLRLLPLLFPLIDGIALEEESLGAAEFLDRFRAREQTDAEVLVQRFEAAPMPEGVVERMFDDLDLAFVLAPGPDVPSRIMAGERPARPRYQRLGRSRVRPDVVAEWKRPPKRIRWLSGAKARLWIDQARGAMLTRNRDLEAIAYANPEDVVEVVDQPGLKFIGFGISPARRFLLEGTYVFLVVHNGVPVGYMQGSGLMGWAEINFNVFEPFRGGDSAHLYGRSLAVLRGVMGTQTFVLSPYQIGDGNEEAIATGAFWFYYKLGFRPRDASIKRLVARELATMKRRSGHRTSATILRRLAEQPMFLSLGKPRNSLPYGVVGQVGLAASEAVSAHSKGDRDAAIDALTKRAARTLHLASARLRSWSADEQLALRNWAPLIGILPGIARWSKADRRALADVVRARGGRTEAEYLERLGAHPKLEASLVRLVGR